MKKTLFLAVAAVTALFSQPGGQVPEVNPKVWTVKQSKQ